jgi:hypothetical protein
VIDWDALHQVWQAKRINRIEAYSLDVICTNQVGSFFSRLRAWLMVSIIMFRRALLLSMRSIRRGLKIIATKPTARGRTAPSAWRSDTGVSRIWKGYWQLVIMVVENAPTTDSFNGT